MLTDVATSLKHALNRANPNTLASNLASIALGDVLRSLPTQLRAVAPVLDPYGPASNTSIVLPDDAKAAVIFRAFARAGTATSVELTVEATAVSVSTGQCCVSPDGNIIFYAADAWTSVDVLYLPAHQRVIEVTLPVVSGVVTLPVGVGVACELLEAQRADTSTANLIVALPAATNTTTGSAHLNLLKTTVLLDSADSATSVRLKLGVVNKVDVNALLEAASNSL
jgi:hypothetical protein